MSKLSVSVHRNTSTYSVLQWLVAKYCSCVVLAQTYASSLWGGVAVDFIETAKVKRGVDTCIGEFIMQVNTIILRDNLVQ